MLPITYPPANGMLTICGTNHGDNPNPVRTADF